MTCGILVHLVSFFGPFGPLDDPDEYKALSMASKLPLKSAEDDLTLGLVWIMLLVDMVVFAFIIFYFDNVKPGPFGTARKPYFFLTVNVTSFKELA